MSASHVHPTQEDPVVAALSERVGGPVGPRAGRSRWWTPSAVVLALAALSFALGMVQKAPCVRDDWSQTTNYSAMCYSDLPFLYSGRGLAEHEWPYSTDPQVRDRFQVMEYPVGISYYAWATSWVTYAVAGFPDLEERAKQPVDQLFADPEIQRETRLFVVLNALGLAALTILAAWALTRVNPRRPWDAAIFAASPSLVLTGLINWDILAVALVAGALWTFARGRNLLTGVLLGLGAATKLYPGFLLGPILVIYVRQRRWRDLAVVTGGTVLAWVAANAPAYSSGPGPWKVFWSFNAERGADLGSIWMALSQLSDVTFSSHTINLASEGFFVAWCLGVATLGLLAPRTPRLAQLGFLVVAGFLLVNKVYSPQYVLWLLPLAAMARPRWRDQLIWQAGEVFYFAIIWLYLGGYLRPGNVEDTAPLGDAPFYWLGIVVRMACELYLVVLITRDVLSPAHDPVEQTRLGGAQDTTTRSNAVVV